MNSEKSFFSFVVRPFVLLVQTKVYSRLLCILLTHFGLETLKMSQERKKMGFEFFFLTWKCELTKNVAKM